MESWRLTLNVAWGSFGCQSIDRIALVAVASTKDGGEGGVRLQLVDQLLSGGAQLQFDLTTSLVPKVVVFNQTCFQFASVNKPSRSERNGPPKHDPQNRLPRRRRLFLGRSR